MIMSKIEERQKEVMIRSQKKEKMGANRQTRETQQVKGEQGKQ